MCRVPLRGTRTGGTFRFMSPDVGLTPSGPHRWEDFLSLDDDDRRELIDGHFLEIELPNELHEWIVAYLVTSLMNWALPRRAGFPFASGYKVRISETRGVLPDVQFFRSGRGRLPEAGLDRGAPDLAIEIVSPSSKRFDRVVKLAWYASIGTPEYWIVDPPARSLERYLLDHESGVLELVDRLHDDARFAPETFPELEIELARLWTLPDV
jgi:Uma2 family endonuclease